MQNFNEFVPGSEFIQQRIKQDMIRIDVNNEQGVCNRLIVNGDDFGISQPRSRGIMELIRLNRVGSVSVLVSGVNGGSVNQDSKQLRDYVLQRKSNNNRNINVEKKNEQEQHNQNNSNNNNNQDNNNNNNNQDNHTNTHTSSSPSSSSSSLLQSVSVGLHFNLTQGPCLSHNMPCQLINPLTNSFMGKLYIYQYMDKLKQTNSSFPLPVKQLIKSQLRLQIQKFIELFNFRPSHIDGHNHVHCIPQVAQIIGVIMQQYGVYKTRLPFENLKESNAKSQLFVNNAKLSRSIFDKYKIIYPSRFIGCEQINKLDFNKINQKIQEMIFNNKNNKDQEQQQQSNNRFIELMCHPGYSDPGNGDEFNQSENREVQMNSLKSNSFSELFIKNTHNNNNIINIQNQNNNNNIKQTLHNNSLIKLSNYNFLQPPLTQTHKKRILLYSKMNSGCGNYTTSLRLQQIFQSLGYQVYLRSIEQNINTQYQIQSLKLFLIHFHISLVIGVNLTRSGRVIYHATRSINSITNKVSYFFIVAGTDANIYFHKPEAVTVLKQPIQNCQLLVSLSDSMVKLTSDFIVNQLHLNNNQKHIILLSQSSNLLAYQQNDKESIQSVYDCLKLNYNLSPKTDKYIVFPASFRPVKDIQFLLKAFNQLIDQQQGLRVLILGPVLDDEYYSKCVPQMGRVQYLGSLQKQLYVQVLKNALFLVNTSLSQGQSCSIQQAQQCGQLCVVRKNQGNAELVKHLQTGLLFDTPQQFLQLFNAIKKNQNNFTQRLKQNGLKFHSDKFSIQVERQSYKKIFDSILPQDDSKLLTYTDVHTVSQININLYNSVPEDILKFWFHSFSSEQQPKRIIDIGCGSGIFSLTILNKFHKQIQHKINLQLYDYTASIMSNCYYNCLQELGGRLKHVQSVLLRVSDMFTNVNNINLQPNLYVANLPQTPFKNDKSRPDKNAGVDSLKFNKQLITKFSTFHEGSLLIMLYSYLSHPSKFFNLLEELNLQILWKSQKHYFNITSKQYDQMEDNLSQFIKQHINQGKAQVQIIQKQGEQVFIVPAQILVIKKKIN